jgi:arylsulfatase A-like enzyme
MDRRSFLRVFAVAAVMVVAPFAKADAPARPNFLFVYTDDQRWDALGVVQREEGEAGRFPWIRTPNMDRLAAEGVRFRNAFVVNSLCAPSRAVFLSGQYNHENGVSNNHTPFPLDNVTSSALLRQAGYRTAYFGKWHHAQQKERPGFDRVASFLGQGRYNDCPFNVDGTMTPTHGRVDDVSTDYAIDFLKDHVAHHPGQPFDVVVGYKAVHDPRIPADEDKGLYEGEKPRPVPNLEAHPPFRPGERLTMAAPKRRNEGQLNYFRCVTSADRSLGRLLDALDELKLADNTVVVFTSDNGYYMGEHGLGDKRSAYDESLRIPFIVRYPKGAPKGATVDAMVLNVDLAPTLLDFAGVAVPKEMQGRSWKPLLAASGTPEWRKAFFYEYFFERGFASPTTLAVRTDDAKLIKYPGHDEWTELFDLKADPYETKNLYSDPAAKPLRERMEAEFDRQAKAVDYHVPATADKYDPKDPGHF